MLNNPRFVGKLTDGVGTFFNADNIRSFQRLRDGTWHVILYDDNTFIIDEPSPSRARRMLEGSNFVIQMMPIPKPMWVVFRHEDGVVSDVVEVLFLGLCADGHVRPVRLTGKKFKVLDLQSKFGEIVFENPLKTPQTKKEKKKLWGSK
ncbi:MAG: hypothetical protein FWE33_06630 [Defluviitaleaceae bacterium]|nr:hypothetical protein [Defluviitaleaceae bacterium]